MSPLLWLATLSVVFVACRWSGRLLDRHYADRTELGAVALVGVCVLGPIGLGAGAAEVWGVPIRALLLIAVVAGLVVSGPPPAGRPASR
jgi:hypothetical protein